MINFSWNLSSYETGSEFVRYANELGSEGNPVISGTQVPIASATGSKEVPIHTLAYVPNYPRAFFYAFHRHLGVNEFGVSRGLQIIDLPAAFYNENEKCLY